MEKGLFLVLRLRDGILKSGMAGGCLGYRRVGGRQNSVGRGNWKREYIYIFLYFAQEKPDVSSVCSALCYKLDFLFKNLFLTYFLSKIFIKYYINLIKPIQLKK